MQISNIRLLKKIIKYIHSDINDLVWYALFYKNFNNARLLYQMRDEELFVPKDHLQIDYTCSEMITYDFRNSKTYIEMCKR